MAMNLVKLPTGKPNLQLRVSKGHYATSHSHINYYIDVTLTKFRLSEARAAAQELVRGYRGTTIIDTILCLDGTDQSVFAARYTEKVASRMLGGCKMFMFMGDDQRMKQG